MKSQVYDARTCRRGLKHLRIIVSSELPFVVDDRVTSEVRLRHPPGPPRPRKIRDIDPDGLFVWHGLDSRPGRPDFKDFYSLHSVWGTLWVCKDAYSPVHTQWLENSNNSSLACWFYFFRKVHRQKLKKQSKYTARGHTHTHTHTHTHACACTPRHTLARMRIRMHTRACTYLTRTDTSHTHTHCVCVCVCARVCV